MVRFYRKRILRKGKRTRYGKLKKRRYPKRSNTGFLATRQVELKAIELPINTLEYIHQESFTINTLPQVSTFARLFDQYRIKRVNVRVYPTTYTEAVSNNRLLFASSVDLDGGSMNTFAEMTECSNCKLSPWAPDVHTSTKSITLTPRFRNNIVQDATDPQNVTYSSTLGRRNAWIDLADGGNTQHFGLNLGWMAANGTGTLNEPQQVQFVITYYLEFRKIR